MKNICKNCKSWKRSNNSKMGSCHNFHFVYNDSSDKKQISRGLVYWDSVGYAAFFSTGESFGCIHFKPNKPEVKDD